MISNKDSITPGKSKTFRFGYNTFRFSAKILSVKILKQYKNFKYGESGALKHRTGTLHRLLDASV